MVKRGDNYRYVSLALLFLILALSFFIIKPFFISLAWAVILAYLFFPINKQIRKVIKNRTLTSLLMVIIVLLVILIPLTFVAGSIFTESVTLFKSIGLTKIQTTVANYFNDPRVGAYIREGFRDVSNFLISSISRFIVSIPGRFLELFVIFFVLFYLFKDGEKISDSFMSIFPKQTRIRLVYRFKDITSAVIYGMLLIALVQGILGAIGFAIFGISNPLFWGFVMVILAMIPFFGPTFVWLPAAIIELVNLNYISGIGLLLYGIIIISSIDNILKPKLISYRADIHPITVLLGILGGLFVFGLIGVILGPLVLAFLITLMEVYSVKR